MPRVTEMNVNSDLLSQLSGNVIQSLIPKWKEALKKYYIHGYDNGESMRLYRELEDFGCDSKKLLRIELDVRKEVYNFN